MVGDVSHARSPVTGTPKAGSDNNVYEYTSVKDRNKLKELHVNNFNECLSIRQAEGRLNGFRLASSRRSSQQAIARST
jgi:hypothetical protein